ncbi:SRPBCC family protein [Nocardioides sp.]|uniref:SRPBCC family protein n=1 Tax=Nocardioides sp. TaxID=35761 RepID=UPI002C71E71C|nr:SRPBCC family protein [Nocardioides sp.]HSX66489.1 SRPBCC family protein [Nocardioides sp.]
MRATSTATVNVPITRAWEVLADHAGMSKWGPITATVEKPGAPERDGVGAVRRIAAPGPAPAIVEEITAFDAPTRLGYKALAGVPFKDYSGEVVLSPAGDGTLVEWTLTARSRIPLVEQAALKAVSVALLKAYTGYLKKRA